MSVDAPTVIGVLIAATGAAHFAAPDAFTPVTERAFSTDIQQWTYRNGATELAVGTAIAVPATRKLGYLALAGYVGFLGYRVATKG